MFLRAKNIACGGVARTPRSKEIGACAKTLETSPARFTRPWRHTSSAGASNYSKETYDPLKAFVTGNLSEWISHVARFYFKRKLPFRDYTTPGKGNGIYQIADRTNLSLVGDWGTGTDEAQMVATEVERSKPDYTIHLGDVYFVGDPTEVRENFLGEKTRPVRAGEVADGREGQLRAG